MAISQKGSRLITVGGIEYRWTVRPDGYGNLGIVVQITESSGQRMVVWIADGNAITPRIAELAIRAALEQGWNPVKPGKELRFRVESSSGENLNIRAY